MNGTLERPLSDLAHGDHVCLVYESPAEQLAAVVPFLTDGLARGDRCVYVADGRGGDHVEAALAAAGVDVRRERARGALLTLTREAYQSTGDLEPPALLDLLAARVAEAVAAGFAGVRLAADMTSAAGIRPERLMAYETLVNSLFFPPTRALAFCQYDRRRFAPTVVREALRAHPWLIAGTRVRPNLQYDPPGLARDRESRVPGADWLLGELRRARSAEHTFRTLLRSSPWPIIVLDANLDVRLWNPAAERIFGWSEAEVVGRRYPLVPEDHQTEFQALYASVLRGERVSDIETRRRTRDGEPVDVRISVAPVPGPEGRVELIMVALADIGASKRAEEALRAANQAKDEFLATVSHELRTPLQAILGWTQVLRTVKLDAEAASRALQTVDRNTRALAQLVEELLDLSRITAGKLRLEPRPVDLAGVVQAAVEAARPAATAKTIRIDLALEPGAGAVSGDPDRLQQVAWNLLSNAVKFTPAGGRVEVRVARVDPHIELRVSDTGQGIGAEFLPYVFERFRQADPSITRIHGGLGLGLAIVRHLVELHGGSVTADSPGEGRGATFTVRLPIPAVLVESRDPEQTPPESASRPAPRLAGRRVLVVDDEPDARDLLTTVLRHYGAEVTAAASSAEALAALDSLKPDVLVSDLAMPGEDGYTLIQRVRARSGPWATLPAVALTAYARLDDQQRALAAGFQAHLPKPVEPAALADVVARLASGQHS